MKPLTQQLFTGAVAMRRARPFQGRRVASTAPPYPRGSTGYRISTVFTAVVTVTVAGTSYALYQFYTSMTTYPPELRSDLRAALKTRAISPYESAKFFKRAWDNAREMDASKQGPSWPLKVSGIAIILGEMLEQTAGAKESFLVLQTAWFDLGRLDRRQWTDAIKYRRIALGSKMADLARDLNDSDEEEKWAVWVVEEMLREGLDAPRAGKRDTNADGQSLEELNLPTWVDKTEAASCLERLGALYAKQGNLQYAVPLYLRALGQLPLSVSDADPTKRATATSLCQAALLFNNLAQLFSAKAEAGNEPWYQALQWSKRGMDALREAAKLDIRQAENFEDCRKTAVVLQYNRGMLAEMGMKLDPKYRGQAEELYSGAGEQALRMKWSEAAKQADDGLRRVANKNLKEVMRNNTNDPNK